MPSRPWRVLGTVVEELPAETASEEYLRWYAREPQNREAHPWREVLVARGGTTVFGLGERLYTVEEGTILLIEKFEPHALLYPPQTAGIVHYWMSLLEQSAVVSMVTNRKGRISATILKPMSLHAPLWSEFVDSWEALARCPPHARGLEAERFRSLAVTITLDLLREEDRNPPTPPSLNHVVKTVCAFIETHPQGKLSLEELSALAGYSKYHFHRVFQRVMGETLHDFSTRRRVSYARDLLAHGYTCRAAAKDLGFSSVSAFSRWFKENTGSRPSAMTASAEE